jgi:CPA2 family monovalent cation:H+ antiporter-2
MSPTDPGLPYLRETLLFLVLAGILIPLLQRLRVNQVLGFLAAGAVVGPHGLGRWAESAPMLAWLSFPRAQGVEALASLGVLFLMFLIGLEISMQRLWALRAWVFGAGSAQVLVSAAVLGGIAWAFGNGGTVALLLGLVLSLSSTAVVMQLLTQGHALHSEVGRAAFSVLMLQDLAVVPLLMLLDVLQQRDASAIGPLMAIAAGKSVLAVGLVLVVGRRAVGPAFRKLTHSRQPETLVALTLLTTLGIAGLTWAAGLSMPLGAFLAGLLLAETEFRHEVEVTLEPFKGLLMGVFFMSVGMSLDLAAVREHPLWLPASVLGLFAIKGAVAAAVLRLAGLRTGQAVHAGLLLGQGGEFAFVVVAAASAMGLLLPQTAQFMLLVVSASLFFTPAAAQLGAWLAQRFDAGGSASAEHHDPAARSGHVIVAGAGRVGQLLIELLGCQQRACLGIDHQAAVVRRLREQGHDVFFGNAARPETLRRLGAARAAAVVITMDEPTLAMRAVKAIRQEFPALPIYARSRDEAHARDLLSAGATTVVPETLEAALQLAASALQRTGMAESDVADVVDEERARRVERCPAA